MGMFEGALTALVTPFRGDAVDEKALREIVEHQIANGIDGLVSLGTTGESFNLSHAEYEKVARITIEQVRGRVPVVVGVGTASTRHTLELTQMARAAKADGVLVVSPYYCKPSQEGLYQHFKAVADLGLPVMLYNIPGRSCVDIALDTMDRLAKLPGIVAIKESTGNVVRSADILARFGSRFTVLSGDDGITLPIMSVGGHGVVSVASNVAPREVSQLVKLFRSGDVNGARALAEKLRPLFEVLFVEPNPGPAKGALAQLGRLAPEIRLPMVMPTDATQARLRVVLGELGLS
jgi:4-hydroxy-tetrahydrodipicolinate synthase